jgi:hypothetical protein
MINTGAIGNFISPKEVERLGFNTMVKEPDEMYQLTVVNGDPANDNAGWIEVETAPLRMLFPDRHYEIIQLDLVEMANHGVILGMPWVEYPNPQVDWVTKEINFN